MRIDALALIGAGGHAAVVVDAAMLQGFEALAVLSQNPAQAGHILLGHHIELIGADTILQNFHVAIGDNSVRVRLHAEFSEAGAIAVTIIHPHATVAASSRIGAGSFVAAGAILAPRSRVGEGVIINHRAIVDHDVVVHDFSHVAPGVVLGGGVQIGRRVLVGAGATILPGLSIGDGAIIGAGAVVVADVSPDTTVVGVPGREKEKGT